MLESAFVVLREAAELLLIVVALHACLRRADRADMVLPLWGGLAAGLLAAVWVLAVVTTGRLGAGMEAMVSIGLGLAVMAVSALMLSSGTAIEARMHGLFDRLLQARGARLLLAGAGAFVAFRETFEAGVLLHSAERTHGLVEVCIGAALGLAVTVLAALAFRQRKPRGSLLAVYRLSTLLLCFIAIQFTVDGVALLLVTPAAATEGRLWVAALTAGSTEYNLLCIALMLGPLALIVQRWWSEAAPAR